MEDPGQAPERVRVAALLACHNRRDTTLAALDALLHQKDCDEVDLRVHLVDDASSDGTPEEVARRFPQVNILHGDGQRFWNGGMHMAFAAALRTDPDFYLWLNDDTVMDPDALSILLTTHRHLEREVAQPCIVAASTRDPDSGQLTYGGVHRPSRARALRFDLVAPGSTPREVETMNGNCVLIPRDVAVRVGNLEPAYTHGMGDYDYGLRAREAGCAVWITPGMPATCSTNPPPRYGGGTLADDWDRIRSVKGLPPDDWRIFARRWAGTLWPVYYASPYVRRGLAALRAAR